MSRIQSHEELDVYQLAFEAAMRIFEVNAAIFRRSKDRICIKPTTLSSANWST